MNKTTTAVVCVLVAVSLIGCGNPADAAPMFGSRYRSLLPKGTPTRESLQQKMDRLRASQEKVRNSGGKVDSGFECDACDVVVGVIQELFLGEKTEEEAEAICTSVCVDLKMYNHRVCSLGVQEFKVYIVIPGPPMSHPPPSPFQLPLPIERVVSRASRFFFFLGTKRKTGWLGWLARL